MTVMLALTAGFHLELGLQHIARPALHHGQPKSGRDVPDDRDPARTHGRAVVTSSAAMRGVCAACAGKPTRGAEVEACVDTWPDLRARREGRCTQRTTHASAQTRRRAHVREHTSHTEADLAMCTADT